MATSGMVDLLRRVVRDPYTLLLAVAAAVQITVATSPRTTDRPEWAIAATVIFGVTCLLALLGRLRNDDVLQTAAPFVLLVSCACWRVAERGTITGFGALALVAVAWLGLYGTRHQLWVSIAGTLAALVLPPLVIGDGIGTRDVRQTALTVVLAILIGTTLNSLVQRGTRAVARVSALEPAESRLDAVLRAATGHLIITCDRSGRIIDFNHGAEQVLGWRAEDVVGKLTPLAFLDPDEETARAALLGTEPGFAIYSQAAERGELDVDDWTLIAKDGRRIIVSLTITGMRDGSGDLTGFVGIGTDVTETRAATRALDAEREIYRLLVEHLPLTTVALIDSELRCLTIGGHWTHVRDADAEQSARGRHVSEFFAAQSRTRVVEFFTEALARPVEMELTGTDGRDYELSGLPVGGPDGEKLLLSVMRDVTAGRRAEDERREMIAALRVSEATFREAFEGAPIGMALVSVQSSRVDRFLQINNAFAAILGRSPDELIDVAVEAVTHPDDIALQPELSGDAPHPNFRKRFVRPSGREVWVEVSYAVVLDGDGRPSHVVKQIQDLSTIKQSERALLDALEQQRAAAATLRELDRIRNEVVGNISHELRTPLTSIQGYLELMTSEPLTPHQATMIDVAARNAERLSNLVDNLLVLVRLDAADAPASVENADVAVADAVAAAVATMRPKMNERNQQLTVRLPERPAIVNGDVEQLDRALLNLLSNASKYTPSGGRIEIVVTTDADTVAIAIGDSGIGIALDEQEQLFTRFFRATSARENRISGNGLGLAIVKSIVERHAGQVAVESSPGTGSRFTITLPLAMARA